MKSIALVLACALGMALVAPLGAASATPVTVAKGKRVPLKFEAAFDSSKVTQGETVTFSVAADVMVARLVIIRKGAPAEGVITQIDRPGVFGKNARVTITSLKTTAVDGRPVRLSRLIISADNTRQTKDVAGAIGVSGVGLILLGPLGLAAGALVRGGHVNIPAGSVAVVDTRSAMSISVP